MRSWKVAIVLAVISLLLAFALAAAQEPVRDFTQLNTRLRPGDTGLGDRRPGARGQGADFRARRRCAHAGGRRGQDVRRSGRQRPSRCAEAIRSGTARSSAWASGAASRSGCAWRIAEERRRGLVRVGCRRSTAASARASASGSTPHSREEARRLSRARRGRCAVRPPLGRALRHAARERRGGRLCVLGAALTESSTGPAPGLTALSGTDQNRLPHAPAHSGAHSSAAQEPVRDFTQLNTRLVPGDTVWVTDAQGREVKGGLARSAPTRSRWKAAAAGRSALRTSGPSRCAAAIRSGTAR